ncbi:glycosyltransferase family 61 protein [Cerasicoccus arenae]|uniref:Glycosyltransferase 61 catalytic domain-containing protein n=1 Tax=Cerasicoccus arenae TaxID=424488 RepID=A0A8J3GDF6_9BACT|nr:glycosyltransferase family 61 protein [Cerasicoccus arenae]MBK1857493.1 glycosyltransferase family 61 protein [Cerasicoccus arenae]GHB95340.1 hypothetical protein GCM10007047_08820 [Cerasicoccus arenae]
MHSSDLVQNVFDCHGTMLPWLPRNVDDEHRGIYQSYFERPLPQMELKTLHNVLVSSTGIIYKRFQPLLESHPFYFQPDHDEMKNVTALYADHRLRRWARDFLLYKLERVNNEVYWCTDTYSIGFYHWLVEALPRIYLASLLQEKPHIYLPGCLQPLSFVHESLNFFPDVRFDMMKPASRSKFKKMRWVSQMGSGYQFNPPLMKALRDHLIQQAGIKRNPKKRTRLFISRKKAPKRKIINEDEVESALKPLGFQTVYFEDYSLLEQMKLCANAELFVGIHGAGLSNMLFLPPDAKVLEIQKLNDWASCFFRLAHSLDLDYYYTYCPHFPPEEVSELKADLVVDVDQLLTVISSMTEKLSTD